MKDFLSMLKSQLVKNYIRPIINDRAIINAFLKIPRHLFVDRNYQNQAYENYPLPIGFGQTISQPSLVAQMTQLLKLMGKEKVLEIGTGSGYQAAILASLADKVYTIERIPALAKLAQKHLKKLNITNVKVIIGDGSEGLIEFAPFNAIIVTASSPTIPQPLINQLAENGRIVIPVLEEIGLEILKVGLKKNGKLIIKNYEPVKFVPLIGKFGFRNNKNKKLKES